MHNHDPTMFITKIITPLILDDCNIDNVLVSVGFILYSQTKPYK